MLDKDDTEELQENLKELKKTMAMLLRLSDETVPELKNEINEIIDKIKGGIDKTELAKQIKAVMNQVIVNNDYGSLLTAIETSSKTMINAVEKSSQKVEEWERKHHKRATWHIAIISGAMFFAIGFGVCYWWTKPTISQQQEIYSDIDSIAKFVNSHSGSGNNHKH